MTTPHDDLLEHSFDGIREFDNPPPRWIMAMLYASVVFAAGYWLYFHTFAIGSLPDANYRAEVARAAEVQLAKVAAQPLSDQTLQLMAAVPAQVAEGRRIFEQFCVVCHGPNGEGNVGPNLTDAYWIHGGAPMRIHATVTNGVLEKGMVAWGGQLGPARVQKVVAYVLSIKNTNRPGKAPQGTLDAEAPATGPAGTSVPEPPARTGAAGG